MFPGRDASDLAVESADPGGHWLAAGRRGRRLGPAAGNESAVPADLSREFHEQEHLGEPAAVERGEDGEDDAVSRSEPGLGEGWTRRGLGED